MTAEHSGIDALMAAITDEPLPADADAATRAEHRAATADLAVLREQLGIIGHALSDPSAPAARPVPEPAPRPARPVRPTRRRMFRVALGSLAVAAAASVVTGLGWLVSQSGMNGAADDSGGNASEAAKGQADSDGGTFFSSPRYLACAYLVAEGTVTAAAPAGNDPELVRVKVTATEVYVPAAPAAAKSVKDDPLTYVIDKNTAPGLRTGDEVMIGVPEKGAPPDMWIVGEKAIAPERDRINRALSDAADLGCS
ncbi:hypothetical protein Stsp02_12660 [Streptomyces sp. NBRC 14336]|uniref:hypothetical protein n=1 Tax=Streptomyces sp. NBRC 14336 TaxID=3030992 RepID=UPI0024A33906|nr:hypothetical protein [Streptomyces sp. NBRC 14336]WBO78028.1 hypothetical protein SBE_001598 [Streptomyces sp. SBE_14.2]GLW45604.1 hypothetical protein Stsp02_12660 [Streptomyces sp. NBRC 14336]